MDRSAETVDGYIAAAPEEIRGKLSQLRSIIKKAAPKALERISYGMPYYDYFGRLAYFGRSPHHIGLYIPPPVIGVHQHELKGYKTTLSAVHLSPDSELPVALITKLIKARMKINETAR